MNSEKLLSKLNEIAEGSEVSSGIYALIESNISMDWEDYEDEPDQENMEFIKGELKGDLLKAIATLQQMVKTIEGA